MNMQALLVRQAGWPNAMKVEQLPRPEGKALEPDEILVRVRAAGLNFADVLVIGGSYQEKQALPFIPGAELCGDVVALGRDVDSLQAGDRVMGQVGAGAYAEYAVMQAGRVATVPEGMNDEVAAGFYIPYGTAMCALEQRGRLRAGETLLVLSAAGSVGMAAIQVGKALGATVVGVSRNESKRAAVLSAGADGFVVHNGGDLKAALRSAGFEGVDVVLDTVGGETTHAALRCLRFEGRLVVVGFTSGDAPQLRANLILVKNIDIIGCYWGPYQTLQPVATRQAFATLANWYASGRLKPHVSHTIALADIGSTLEKLASGAFTGKVVATVFPPLTGERA